ncbi:PEGA domain-containing protein [Sorangium sp. So ce117]|uniref:PEGA domain-containing protein n=1 Tax=Sorangium sp. So ce117 TaxID=3133277 RepID=UPI003F5EEB02
MLRESIARIAVAITLVTAAPAVALAAPGGAQDDVMTEKVRELHKEGNAHYARGDYERARVAYLAAWALQRRLQIAGNLAEAEMKLGRFRDAAHHLAHYLREAPKEQPPPPAAEMKAAEALFAAASAQVGTLSIAASENGAEILVDGEVVGVAPLSAPVFVEPGMHTVSARRGQRFATRDVQVDKGGAASVEVVLEEGSLNMSTTPPRAEPPASAAPKPPTSTAPERPAGGARVPVVPVVIGGALGVVGLGVGLGFTLAANAKAADVDGPLRVGDGDRSVCYRSQSAACAKLGDAVDDLDAFTTTAVVGYVVGGAAIAATAGYVLWSRSAGDSHGKAQVMAAPWLAPGGGGVGVAGRF